MSIDYRGQPVALLTQHGKERVIGPALASALGCEVHHVSGFDTDQLGTFSRDIPRAGSQRDAARRKAEMGMRLSGLPVGVASEGAFGPDPFSGMFGWNIEIVIWLDPRHGIDVVGMAQAPARCAHLQTTLWSELESFALREDFPNHQLVLRPEGPNDPRLVKGIADWDTLRAQFQQAQAQAASGQVLAESDLRAHAHPSRMQNIERATQDLAARLRSLCPACGTPGYASVETLRGLPCADCGTPTSAPKGEVWGCVACSHRQTIARLDLTAACAAQCPYCNP